jgi:hypothetical protein
MKREYIIQGLPIFVALILVILTSGCATARMYQGEKLPKEQIAIIKVSRSHYVYFPPTFIGISGIDVLAIDNESIQSRAPKLIPDYTYVRLATRIEVLSGFHTVYIVARKEVGAGSYFGPVDLYKGYQGLSLLFYAEAGHEYRIKVPYWWKKGSLIRIVDVGSEEVVASEIIK